MGSGHGHGVSAAGRHRRALLLALVLTASFMVVELVVGLALGSLALLSDAGHMLTDVTGLVMALAAAHLAARRPRRSHTYGLYRLEVLAALANAVLLLAVAAYVLYEAVGRLREPPDVAGVPLLAVAAVGLLVNVAAYRLLRAGAQESLNVRGAFLEVLSDLLGSLGVIVAGIVLIATGWPYADPIVGAAIGLFIVPRAARLGKEALSILLELAPPGIDLDAVERRLRALPGVHDVHDLHIWTLTSGLRAATGHVTLADHADLDQTLRAATEVLEDEFAIEHVTIQAEPAGFREQASPI